VDGVLSTGAVAQGHALFSCDSAQKDILDAGEKEQVDYRAGLDRARVRHGPGHVPVAPAEFDHAFHLPDFPAGRFLEPLQMVEVVHGVYGRALARFS